MKTIIVNSLFLSTVFSTNVWASEELSRNEIENKCSAFKEVISSYFEEVDESERIYSTKFVGNEDDAEAFLAKLDKEIFFKYDSKYSHDKMHEDISKNCSFEKTIKAYETSITYRHCDLMFDFMETYRTLAEESKVQNWSRETNSKILQSFIKTVKKNFQQGREMLYVDGLIILSVMKNFEEFKLVKFNDDLEKLQKKNEEIIAGISKVSNQEGQSWKKQIEKEYCDSFRKKINLEHKAAKELSQKIFKLLEIN